MPAARNTNITSSSTGITYFIDAKGLAHEIFEDDDYVGCECEQDWNCGLHGGTTRPTWIETRYDGLAN